MAPRERGAYQNFAHNAYCLAKKPVAGFFYVWQLVKFQNVRGTLKCSERYGLHFLLMTECMMDLMVVIII